MSDTAQGPSAPNITIRNLIEQFWADIYGKEVQSANTYFLHLDCRPDWPFIHRDHSKFRSDDVFR
jgi:hypothetical protein